MTPNEILDLPLDPDNDSGYATVRGYLIALVARIWEEGEGFSGKRPFGNSGWEHDLLVPLVRAGAIDGALDEHGYLDRCDDRAGQQLIHEAIAALGEPAGKAPATDSDGSDDLAEFSDRHPSTQAILRGFRYGHLPEHLQAVSKPVCELAFDMVRRLPDDPELVTGLRKLREGKDCLVLARVLNPTDALPNG